MPKFIGKSIEGSIRVEDNASDIDLKKVRITYSQAKLLPTNCVFCSLCTTDKGGRGTYAKRWYRWFASPWEILTNEETTKKMRRRAIDLLEKLGEKNWPRY